MPNDAQGISTRPVDDLVKGRHHPQRRAPRRPIKGTLPRLAVNRQNPDPVAAQIVRKDLEHTAKRRRLQEPELTAEPAVTGQAILKDGTFSQPHRCHPTHPKDEITRIHPAAVSPSLPQMRFRWRKTVWGQG